MSKFLITRGTRASTALSARNSGGPARWVLVVRVIRQQIFLVEWRLVSDIKRNQTPVRDSRGFIRQVRKFTRAGLELAFDSVQVNGGSTLSLMTIAHAFSPFVNNSLGVHRFIELFVHTDYMRKFEQGVTEFTVKLRARDLLKHEAN